MKKLIGVLIVSLISFGAFSQGTSSKTITKDYFFMKDGKMMATKNGESVEMTNNVHLINGSTLKTDGTIEMSDGSTRTLKEGETVDLDGKISKPKKK